MKIIDDLKEEVVVPEDKKVAYCLLAWFLGCFGVHNFWLGNKKKGMLQLKVSLIGLLACCTGPLFGQISAWYDIVMTLRKKG